MDRSGLGWGVVGCGGRVGVWWMGCECGGWVWGVEVAPAPPSPLPRNTAVTARTRLPPRALTRHPKRCRSRRFTTRRRGFYGPARRGFYGPKLRSNKLRVRQTRARPRSARPRAARPGRLGARRCAAALRPLCGAAASRGPPAPRRTLRNQRTRPDSIRQLEALPALPARARGGGGASRDLHVG